MNHMDLVAYFGATEVPDVVDLCSLVPSEAYLHDPGNIWAQLVWAVRQVEGLTHDRDQVEDLVVFVVPVLADLAVGSCHWNT